MLKWACRRAGVSVDALAQRPALRKLPEWLSGDEQPTFKQLEAFAKATHTPFGFLFLPEPPDEPLPIPDLRTMRGERTERPSANMLDTIYTCQQRQDWYRENAQTMDEEPLTFVGSVQGGADVLETAAQIRAALGLETPLSELAATNAEALRKLLDRLDALGVLVMVSGYVGTNTRRTLDPNEFRGFALVDPLAPLIFVNGQDSKAAQLFTLIHELAHIWAGQSGVSDVASSPRHDVERWCNAVAAEVLVPLDEFRRVVRPGAEPERLAAKYRVSTLVILRRMLDAGFLTREEHDHAYDQELARLNALLARRKDADAGGGGNYYATARYRLGKRFATAVIASAWEGRSTFTEAFRLLGCRNVKTLEALGERLGIGACLSGGPV
jgi:Zn-dependent peptidase ImmA (M78 family)